MAFIETWDETKPAGSRALSLGDDDIREFKRSVREREAIDHNWFDSESGESNIGCHKKVTLLEQASDPLSLANAMFLYTKEADSYSDLYNRHENAGVQRMTRLGKLWISALGIASEAQGDILYHNGMIWTRLGAGTSGQYLKTQGAGANPTWATLTAGSPGNFSTLIVKRASASTVDIDGTNVVLGDGSGGTIVINTVDETADITASGANGLDTGAEAVSTWYYVWLIGKADGTCDSLLSTSPTSPTMPSGYTFKAMVGGVYNDSSGNFVDFTQNGKFYSFSSWQLMASGNVGWASWTAINTAAFVPSGLSDLAFGEFYHQGPVGFISNINTIDPYAMGLVNCYGDATTGQTNEFWQLAILTANTLYWNSSNAADRVWIAGFYINKL